MLGDADDSQNLIGFLSARNYRVLWRFDMEARLV